ncbi:hypothetical protein ACFFNY_19615 [Paenibacillus hodogayensis]|uniref:ABC transporter substrate-binding protein n=1 Tax=Paenibacillus hodogayensis TaxID=279208 RepID=A0ABV5VZN2_9BACL
MNKKIATALSMGLVLTVAATACSSGSKESKDPGTPSGDKKGARVKLSLFHTNAGITIPDGTDLNNNPWINIVKDKANVDLEVEIPPYTDFPTKFNLLLASGSLPDIVQGYDPIAAYKAARDGAFIDLKPYYDKSPLLQKVVTPQMMELAKDTVSGKYWRIPMAYDKGPQGQGVFARYDLVQKYNDGKWPETIDEWIELLRKIKKAVPDSIPMSNRVIGDTLFGYGGAVFFNLFGADPYGFRIQSGKIVPNVLLPEYKAAVDVYRQLYAEGIFDQEFATNTNDKWFPKWNSKNVLFQWNSADQLLPGIVPVSGQVGTATMAPEARFAFAPDLKTYPSVVSDPRYAKGFLGTPISGHGMYVSSQSKNPDRAFQVIEAFASDELREAVFWGKEGDTYTVQAGKRVPIADKLGDPNRTWSRVYALLFGYTDGQDAQQALYEQKAGADYFKLAKDSMKQRQTDAEANGLNSLIGYAAPDDAAKKTSEMKQALNKFTTEAIMGKITMDQFDQARKDWEKQYRTLVYGPMQAYLDANKDYLIKLGVKQAGW